MLARLPYLVLETFRSAMKMVRSVVDRKFILLAFEGEAASGYTVGIAARTLARARTVSEITLGLRIAYHHVGELAVPVGYVDRYYGSTYIAKGD